MNDYETIDPQPGVYSLIVRDARGARRQHRRIVFRTRKEARRLDYYLRAVFEPAGEPVSTPLADEWHQTVGTHGSGRTTGRLRRREGS